MKQRLLTPLMLILAATVFLAACASDETGVSTSGLPNDAANDGSTDSPDDLAADGPSTPEESDQPSEPDVRIDPDVSVEKLEPAQPLPEAPEAEPTDLPDQDLPIKSDDVDESTTVPPGDVLGAGPYPVATLDITISHPDAADVSYTISCLGDTATVIGDVGIDERVACERLADAAVRTRLVDGVPKGQICNQQYGGPDVAAIVGSYDGVDGVVVNTSINRTDGCGIADWDFLLAGVLPAPRGI